MGTLLGDSIGQLALLQLELSLLKMSVALKIMRSSAVAPARLAVVGAGWWTQGWHLPHLSRHPQATIAAIVEPSSQIRSSLNPDIQQLHALGTKYNTKTFESFSELLSAQVPLDGVVIGASHKAHYELGMQALDAGLHVFMEKPMTTDPFEARKMADAAKQSGKLFMVNNTANWRHQTQVAAEWISEKQIGEVTHVNCYMGSPLLWLFNDPANTGWIHPSGTMLGNGMAWGQLSHSLAWVLRVTGLKPLTAYCEMNHNTITGADVYDAAIIRCTNGAMIQISGIGMVAGEKPATATDLRPTGKQVQNLIVGTEGMISYSGLDHRTDSGNLSLRRHDFAGKDVIGFEFEDGAQDGIGPASLQAFVAGCQGEDVWNGCDAEVGWRVVSTLEAMYRSHANGCRVDVNE